MTFVDFFATHLQIEPLFGHWIRKNIVNYKECVVMCPDEIGVKRIIMIADNLDVDYATLNSRRKHRTDLVGQGQFCLGKRHARLNHQHLSDNWQLVEDESEESMEEGDGDNAIEIDDEVMRNLLPVIDQEQPSDIDFPDDTYDWLNINQKFA